MVSRETQNSVVSFAVSRFHHFYFPLSSEAFCKHGFLSPWEEKGKEPFSVSPFLTGKLTYFNMASHCSPISTNFKALHSDPQPVRALPASRMHTLTFPHIPLSSRTRVPAFPQESAQVPPSSAQDPRSSQALYPRDRMVMSGA